jgi:hypothetical protein
LGQLFNFRKTTLNSKFLTVQPILTHKVLINSAQQAEDNGNINTVPNFVLGAQWGNVHKNYPQQYLLNRSTDFPNNVQIDSAQQVHGN